MQHVAIRGKRVRVCSLFLSHGSWQWNLGHLAWSQVCIFGVECDVLMYVNIVLGLKPDCQVKGYLLHWTWHLSFRKKAPLLDITVKSRGVSISTYSKRYTEGVHRVLVTRGDEQRVVTATHTITAPPSPFHPPALEGSRLEQHGRAQAAAGPDVERSLWFCGLVLRSLMLRVLVLCSLGSRRPRAV